MDRSEQTCFREVYTIVSDEPNNDDDVLLFLGFAFYSFRQSNINNDRTRAGHVFPKRNFHVVDGLLINLPSRRDVISGIVSRAARRFFGKKKKKKPRLSTGNLQRYSPLQDGAVSLRCRASGYCFAADWPPRPAAAPTTACR